MGQHRTRTSIPASTLIAVFALLAGPVFGQQSGNGMAALESIQSSFHAVAEKVIPAVVEVNTVDIIRQPLRTFSPFRFFFGRPDSEESLQEREFRRPGLGSGVIVRRDGSRVYVITNNHYRGQAIVNALEIEEALGKRDFSLPQHLVDAYPRLKTLMAQEG